MESNNRLYVIVALLVLLGLVASTCMGALAGGAAGYWAGRMAAAKALGNAGVGIPGLPSGPGFPALPCPEATPSLPVPQIVPTVTGARVTEVVADSPASRAGIQVGDVVTIVNGTRITASTTLQRVVRGLRPGDTAELVIWRQGTKRSMRVILGTNPDDSGAAYLGVYYVFAAAPETGP